MTPGVFFAFCGLAEARYRAEQAAMLAQMATAFRADAKHIAKSVKDMLGQE